ncbi:MAG: hypothetical protein O7D34_06720 [Ignavibacteria bacterium]|nr:hypothetical protein [Ignavibacteria bacterium]
MGRRGRQDLEGEEFFFITTTVVKFARVFTQDKYCDILLHNVTHYQKRYKFLVLGYVILPSHFHWIIQLDLKTGSISDIMRDIKKYTAWDVLQELEKDNRIELLNLFELEAQGRKQQQRKFWMERFDDEVIRNRQMFLTKLKYIHNNPVKAELVSRPEDYKYSSARNYVLGDQSTLHVSTVMAL